MKVFLAHDSCDVQFMNLVVQELVKSTASLPKVLRIHEAMKSNRISYLNITRILESVARMLLLEMLFKSSS